MSQYEKLVLRVMKLDKNMRFEELQKILEGLGYYAEKPNGGSHYTFRKRGRFPITIPTGYPVKICYVEQVRDALKMEEEQDEIS